MNALTDGVIHHMTRAFVVCSAHGDTQAAAALHIQRLDVLQKGLFGFALADKEQGAVLRAIRMSRRHYRFEPVTFGL